MKSHRLWENHLVNLIQRRPRPLTIIPVITAGSKNLNQAKGHGLTQRLEEEVLPNVPEPYHKTAEKVNSAPYVCKPETGASTVITEGAC